MGDFTKSPSASAKIGGSDNSIDHAWAIKKKPYKHTAKQIVELSKRKRIRKKNQKRINKEKVRPTSPQRSCHIYARSAWSVGRSDKIIIFMETPFIDFWHLYAPQAQYHNRFLACRRLWTDMDETHRSLIMKELAEKQKTDHPAPNGKNPYFFLIDWQPPQPEWLSPRQVGCLLAQHIPLAVCFNPKTNAFATVTRQDADMHGLTVHHYM